MLPWTLREATALVNGRLTAGNGKIQVTGVCHDSRKIRKGDLFIAIIGNQLDGHRYLRAAAVKGARAAVVSKSVSGIGVPVIRVKDTTQALGALGRAQRLQWDGPVVAVTGSVGKTTVKDMTAHLLAGKFRVLKTEGNLNNQWGLPLTLLSLEPGHEAAVVELGINHPGEMERLSETARPDVAVVTAIGEAHLGFFRDKRHLALEKLKIGTAFRAGRKVVLNAEDPLLGRKGDDVFTFGIKVGQVRAKDLQVDGWKTRFLLEAQGAEIPVRLSMPGEHNVKNALAAVAAGLALGLPLKALAQRLGSFIPRAPMRMEILNRQGILFVNDAYNASPTSMEAALDTFRSLQGVRRKIAVLGDMLEMGEFTKKAHEQVLQRALDLQPNCLLLVGKAFQEAIRGLPGVSGGVIHCFDQADRAGKFLAEIAEKGDAVLLKGSRAMRLEKVLKAF